MGVGIPVCSPIVPDATTPESPITLRTRLIPQPCDRFSKIAVITYRMTKYVYSQLKTANIQGGPKNGPPNLFL